MASKPLVSIIIPTHNRAHMMLRAAQSVLAQTYPSIQLIVADDGSTDDTSSQIDLLRAAPDGDIIEHLRLDHGGAQVARNAGLAAARGAYVKYLDSDDWLDPHTVARQVAALQQDDGADIVYGDWQDVLDLGNEEFRAGSQHDAPRSPDMVENLLCDRWCAPFCYMLRCRAVKEIGPWDETLRITQDLDYFLRGALSGLRFKYVPGLDGYMRQHSGNRVSTRNRSLRWQDTRRILYQAEDRLRRTGRMTPGRAHGLCGIYLQLARWEWHAGGNPRAFTIAFQRINKLCPDFEPADRFYALATRYFGYPFVEQVIASKRRLWRRLGLTRAA